MDFYMLEGLVLMSKRMSLNVGKAPVALLSLLHWCKGDACVIAFSGAVLKMFSPFSFHAFPTRQREAGVGCLAGYR